MRVGRIGARLGWIGRVDKAKRDGLGGDGDGDGQGGNDGARLAMEMERDGGGQDA